MEPSSSSLRRFPHLIDAWQRRQRGISFLVAIIKKYRDDEIGQRAALLTYYAFLSLFPLLLILTTLLDILLRHDPALSNRIIRDLVSYFPLVGRGLENNVHVLHQTGLALIAGILLTLYGTRGVADTLRHILDYIWQVPYHQRARLPAALGRSLLIIII